LLSAISSKRVDVKGKGRNFLINLLTLNHSNLIMATSRLVSAKTMARRTPLFTFLARENPSTLSSNGEIVAVPFSSPINPFAPSKSSTSAKSWTAPKYSIRRQKELRKEAELYGLPQEILPPPFAKSSIPSPSNPTNEQQRLLKGSRHVPETRILDKLAMDKAGPYAGRKGAAFKGKIWERKKEQRLADLKKLLEGADAKAQAWKKVCSDPVFSFLELLS
jgi:hypothetical protein